LSQGGDSTVGFRKGLINNYVFPFLWNCFANCHRSWN